MNRRNVVKTLGLTSLGLAFSGCKKISNKNNVTKKVLVLGGTYFLGPVIVKELLKKGFDVTLFNRGKTNPNLFPQVKKIFGDRELENKQGLFNLIDSNEHWDFVIDTWQKSPLAVQDTAEVLKNKTNHYLYVSTISVYDDWHKIGITEDDALNPIPEMPTNFSVEHRYAIRKTLSEIALKRIIGNKYSSYRAHGLRGFNKRPGSKSEPYWPVRVMRGGQMLIPKEAEYYQVTDMQSLAQFMIHCGKNHHFGSFNVAYQPFDFKEHLQRIKRLTKSNVEWIEIPQKIFEENDSIIYRTNRAGRYRFNIDKAIKHGLQNRPLEQLVLDQINGYLKRHPKDSFKFGRKGSHSLSIEQENDLLKLWKSRRNL